MQNYYNPYYHPGYFANAIQQNYANQQMQSQTTQSIPLRVLLVSNEEEAKATPADLNGNPTFFYNKSANKVYIKQINPQTGAAPLRIFNAEQAPETNTKQPDEAITEQHYNTIIEGINGIYRMLAPLLPQNNISTQPPIMEEPKKAKTSAKNSD